jgi:hypothetical protein
LPSPPELLLLRERDRLLSELRRIQAGDGGTFDRVQADRVEAEIKTIERRIATIETLPRLHPNLWALRPDAEVDEPLERTFGTEPLVGFRAWRIVAWRRLDGSVEQRLAPVSSRLPWRPRERHAAVCTAPGTRHDAPLAGCSCGVWALRSAADAEGRGQVYGEVAMWGRVIELERGFRAQYAYPRALYCYPGQAEDVRPLAALYGVELKVLDDPPLGISDEVSRFANFGISAGQFMASIQNAADAMAIYGTALGSVSLPADVRPLVDRAREDPGGRRDALALAAAKLGKHVVDVHTGPVGQEAHVLGLRLHDLGLQHRRRDLRFTFPSGGSYLILSAAGGRDLLQMLAGREIDVIDLPPGLPLSDLHGYLRAKGVEIVSSPTKEPAPSEATIWRHVIS